MSKHTPGPWRFVPDPHSGDILAVDPSLGFETRLATICAPGMSGAREQETANAHLISAAPDLLAALQEMINESNSGVPGIAYKAIDKAMGK